MSYFSRFNEFRCFHTRSGVSHFFFFHESEVAPHMLVVGVEASKINALYGKAKTYQSIRASERAISAKSGVRNYCS